MINVAEGIEIEIINAMCCTMCDIQTPPIEGSFVLNPPIPLEIPIWLLNPLSPTKILITFLGRGKV